MEIITAPPAPVPSPSKPSSFRGRSSDLPVERLQTATVFYGGSPPNKIHREPLDLLEARVGMEEIPSHRREKPSAKTVLGEVDDGWLEQKLQATEFVGGIWTSAVMYGMFVRFCHVPHRDNGTARMLAWIETLTPSEVSLLWESTMVEIRKAGRDIDRVKKRGIHKSWVLMLLHRDDLESSLVVLRRALERFEYIEGHDRSTSELLAALEKIVSDVDRQATELVGQKDLTPFYGEEQEWLERLEAYVSDVWWSPAFKRVSK